MVQTITQMEALLESLKREASNDVPTFTESQLNRLVEAIADDVESEIDNIVHDHDFSLEGSSIRVDNNNVDSEALANTIRDAINGWFMKAR
jgi:hypothetical protein